MGIKKPFNLTRTGTISTPPTTCTSPCLPQYIISLREVAAGKPRNVHEAVKPETEALSHETEARPM